MSEPIADVATALSIGERDRQEDAVLAQFSGGSESGFAILSDGMGGHEDGDLAARVIVSTIFGAFNLSGRDAPVDHEDLRDRLHNAVQAANQSLRAQVDAGIGQEGMGGTVVFTVIEKDQLSWISVGDSALYLLRDAKLKRLNEVHSLSAQIDLMVKRGMIDAETARCHPQRGCLTSALVGATISRIDCPREPFPLEAGDILLIASDGLEVLGDPRLSDILHSHRNASSQQIAQTLIEAVASEGQPGQDNSSVIVIKREAAEAVQEAAPVVELDEANVLKIVQDSAESLRKLIGTKLNRRAVP